MTENHALNCSTGESKLEEGLLSIALDYGAAGLFIFYMVWQGLRSEKRSDAHLAEFMAKIDLLREKAEDDERALRERYDSVVTGLNSERTELRSNLARKMNEVESAIAQLQQRIDGIMINQETMLSMAKDQLTERKARSAAASMVRQLKETGGADTTK
jgi:chromosome segregation ATPase